MVVFKGDRRSRNVFIIFFIGNVDLCILNENVVERINIRGVRKKGLGRSKWL